MNQTVRIRTFKYPEDYAAVYAIWQEAGSGIQTGRSDEPEEIEKKLRRDHDLFLVAELAGQIIGVVLGGYDGRRGMMYHLAVVSEHRCQGVGEALVEALEQRLRQKGCRRYYLLVKNDNDSVIQFYESRGWERMDLYTYGKDLD